MNTQPQSSFNPRSAPSRSPSPLACYHYRPRPPAAIAALLAAIATLAAPAALRAQFEFTNGFSGSSDWNISLNWDFAGSTASTFPDQGASAHIPTFTPRLTTPITLGDLSTAGSAGLNLNGQTLTVNGTYAHASTGTLLDGTLLAGVVTITVGLNLDDLRLESGDTTLSANLALRNGSVFRNDGTFDITGNFGVSASGGVNTFINEGVLEKLGGGSFSDIGAFFTQGSGVVKAGSGVLRFNGDTEIAGGDIQTTTRIVFDGPTTLGSPTISLGDSGYIDCLGPLTLNGVLTGTGNPSAITRVQSSGGFSGGNFQLDTSAPFMLLGGSQDPLVSATNGGAFFWDSGTLYNFTNTAAKPGDFALRSYGGVTSIGSPTLAGRFVNLGHARQIDQALLLATDGVWENTAGATFELYGATITAQSGATGHLFINAGTIEKSDDGFPPTNSAGIAAPLLSTGTVAVRSNTFTIQGPATLSGDFIVDRSTRADARLELGVASTSALALGDIRFEGIAGGVVDWRSGQFTVTGALSGVGSSGLFHIRGGGVDFIVPAGASASLDFPPQVPVQLGESNNTPEFYLSGPLTNRDSLILFRAAVLGSAAFKNTGSIELDDTLFLSASGGGQTGIFVNNGTFDFLARTGNAITFHPGGFFLNGQPGGPDADPTGGTLTIVGNALTSSFTATDTQFQNQGTVLAPSTGTAISVVYLQEGSNTPLTEVQRATLTFNRPATFNNGILRSSYLDFATDATPSRLEFNDDVTFGGAEIDLQHGGELVLNGSTGDDFILAASLVADGTGRIRMTGGGLAPAPGLTTVGLDCRGATLFRLEGGTLNPTGETLANAGALQQVGGTVGGSFTNGGTHDFDNGNINGAYTNTGAVEWSLGNVTGAFSNGIPQTENVGTLLIHSAGAGSRILTDDSTLSNWHAITQRAFLSLGSRTRIANNRGIHSLDTGGTVGGLASATEHEYELNSLGTLRADGAAGSVQGVGLALFDLNDGRLEAATGELEINCTAITLDGGALVAAPGARLELNAQPTGSGVDLIVANGVIEVNPPATAAAGDLTLRAGGGLSGTGTLIANLTQAGALEPGNSPGTLAIQGGLAQTATATTRIEIGAATHDQVVVTGPATLGGTLEVAIAPGVVPAVGQTFTILTASGGVGGAFADLSVTGLPFLGEDVEVSYTATSVVLTYVANGPSYGEWAAGFFDAGQLADPLVSGPAANPDGDALPNGFEFLFGTSPVVGGDVNPFTFDVVPDPAIPGNRFPTFGVPVAADRSGFTLGIQRLDLNLTPVGRETLSSEILSGEIGGTITLRTVESNNLPVGIYSLIATFR